VEHACDVYRDLRISACAARDDERERHIIVVVTAFFEELKNGWEIDSPDPQAACLPAGRSDRRPDSPVLAGRPG
jgi:hypothetical protein